MLLWLYSLPLCVSLFMSRTGPLLLSQADFIARPWTWAKQPSSVTKHACSYLSRNLPYACCCDTKHVLPTLKFHIHFPTSHLPNAEIVFFTFWAAPFGLHPLLSLSEEDERETALKWCQAQSQTGTEGGPSKQLCLPALFFCLSSHSKYNASVHCCVCNATHIECLVIVSVVYNSCNDSLCAWNMGQIITSVNQRIRMVLLLQKTFPGSTEDCIPTTYISLLAVVIFTCSFSTFWQHAFVWAHASFTACLLHLCSCFFHSAWVRLAFKTMYFAHLHSDRGTMPPCEITWWL